MGSKEFPGFDGWDVRYDEAHHRFVAMKPHPAGKPDPEGHGRLVVVIDGAADLPAEELYERCVRDCLMEDVRVSPPDDVDLWQEKFTKADQAVTVRKVRKALAGGAAEAWAFERLRDAGVPAGDIALVLDGKD